ncbi:MAG: ABC-F family ATP-binding cassette domain-containing protein [Myxococcales bacterium]|nr:ABC-F family ATP-binding cassette domain-containing protein [Myxococcales bacterium]
MSLLVFDDVSLSLGGKSILEGIGLRIADGDRVGLIGPNGSGKSSLLKLMARITEPDGGRIQRQNGLRIGYLPQDIAIEGGMSLVNFLLDAVPGRAALMSDLALEEKELDRLSSANSDADALMACAERVGALHEKLTHLETQYSEHQALRILAGLGFKESDRSRDLKEFSGGWKMRAVLAGLLFQRPDLLLLDEPTNHLDMPSVAWFSSFLKRYKQAFVLICHDREFLNEQIQKVLSFEVEGLRAYDGNYEQYLTQRAEEQEVLTNRARNVTREREHAEQFIKRFRAKASKASQVQSRIKALDKMEQVQTMEARQVVRMRFTCAKRSGIEVQRIENLAKRYGGHEVFKEVNLRVARADRVGIIGVNGAGKTTLLKIMAGELDASEGVAPLGHNVKLGYYAQHHADSLDKSMTVYEALAEKNPEATLTQVRTLLGAFLFRGDDVEKKIAVLSGGERARVALARLLIDPCNYLLMDEPTNHLDLESSEALAEALANYDGTLVFVSHNRSFVRRLATKIWNVEDGHVEVYPGTLDEYMFRAAQ